MSSAAIVDFIRTSTPEQNVNDKPIFEDLQPTHSKQLVRHWMDSKVNYSFESVVPLLMERALTRQGEDELGTITRDGSVQRVSFRPFDVDHLMRPETLKVIDMEEALAIFTIVGAGWDNEKYQGAINSIPFNAWLLASATTNSFAGGFDPNLIYKGSDLKLLVQHLRFFQETLSKLEALGANILPFAQAPAPKFKEGLVIAIGQDGKLSSVGEIKTNDFLLDFDVETMQVLSTPTLAGMLEFMGVAVAEMFKTMSMGDHARLFRQGRGYGDACQTVFQIFYAGVMMFDHLRRDGYKQKWSPVVQELIENPRYFNLLRSEVGPLVHAMNGVADAIQAQE